MIFNEHSRQRNCPKRGSKFCYNVEKALGAWAKGVKGVDCVLGSWGVTLVHTNMEPQCCAPETCTQKQNGDINTALAAQLSFVGVRCASGPHVPPTPAGAARTPALPHASSGQLCGAGHPALPSVPRPCRFCLLNVFFSSCAPASAVAQTLVISCPDLSNESPRFQAFLLLLSVPHASL